MVACHAAKKASNHTVSILTGRKKTAFSYVHSSMDLLQNTPFLHYSCPPGRVCHKANLNKFVTRYGHTNFRLNIFVFFLFLCRTPGVTGVPISFRTLCKNCYKMQTCNLIASIFGTNEECVMVDSCTKFVVNLRSIQGCMSIYLHNTSVMGTG